MSPAVALLAAAIAWTPAKLERLAREMPKAELHLHLDGSLSPATVKTLAERRKHAPLAGKSLEELERLVVVRKPKDSLAEVLQVFHLVYPLLKDESSVELMAYEAASAAARRNVRYLEARFAPALQEAPGFGAEQALKATLAGLARAGKEHGVQTGVIVCLIRPYAFVSRERNERMLELAIAYKDRGVVGVDLAGDEAAAPLSDYKPLFERARKAGLGLTAHAGEAPGSGDIETALEIGVHRLGHAILLREKPALLESVRKRGIAIEVNPTSNIRTGAVASYESHPAKAWLRAGLPVAISTDDPGIFGVDLPGEYLALGLSAEEMLRASYAALDAAFLPETRKKALRARFDDELEKLLKSLDSP